MAWYRKLGYMRQLATASSKQASATSPPPPDLGQCQVYVAFHVILDAHLKDLDT
jgi:hypothetical protein